MRNKEYWQQRMEILEAAQIRKGESYYRDLQDQYRRATQEIERDLSRWYQRFASNNEITLREAKKLLDSGELAEFKWTVREYIQYGKENAFDQMWMKELENASAKVHISRLRSIQIQLRHQIEVLYGGRVDDVSELLQDVYRDHYYHTAYEIQKGFRVGWDLHGIDNESLKKILSKPWTLDGRTFSDKIWSNKQTLINELQTELVQSFGRGQQPKETIRRIAQLLGANGTKPRAATYRAGRLVMTEVAAFTSVSQRDTYSDLGLDRYEYLATLDRKTSDICQGMDDNIFRIEDYEVGVTAPPLHPWCRSTTIPYFDDFTEGEQRIARGVDGKTYFVPGDMSYKEWEATFINGGSKARLKERK